MRPGTVFFLVASLGTASGELVAQPLTSAENHDLTGIVSFDGTPIPGAEVFIYTAHPKSGPSPYCPSCYPDCSKHATTDSSGAFRIKSLADWLKFRVLVVRDGFAPTFFGGVDPQKSPLRAELKKRMDPDNEHAVSGRVVDPHGKAVIGATVNVVGRQDAKNGIALGTLPGIDPVAITDAHGMFRLHSDATDGSYLVQVDARNLAPRIAAHLLVGTTSPAVVQLDVGAAITGHVRDEAGGGLSGVVVEARNTSHAMNESSASIDVTVATATDGRFTLSNIPSGEEYLVFARMESLGPSGRATAVRTTMTDENGSTTPDVDLIAKPAIHVRGRVLLRDGKAMPPGLRLAVERNSLGDAAFVPIDADGGFDVLGVPRDESVALSVKVPGYRLQEGTYTHTGAYLLLSSLQKGTTQFTLVMEPLEPLPPAKAP